MEQAKPTTPVQDADRLLRRIEKELAPETLEPQEGDVNLAGLRRLVTLDALKSLNSALEKLLAKYRGPLEEQRLLMFEHLGINNFNVDGRTVYLHREWWAKAKDPENVAITVAALKACEDTDPFVKEGFNTQSLSAYFRERRIARDEAIAQVAEKCAEAGIAFEEDGESLLLYSRRFHIDVPSLFPTASLAATVDFSEKTSVRSRKGGG